MANTKIRVLLHRSCCYVVNKKLSLACTLRLLKISIILLYLSYDLTSILIDITMNIYFENLYSNIRVKVFFSAPTRLQTVPKAGTRIRHTNLVNSAQCYADFELIKLQWFLDQISNAAWQIKLGEIKPRLTCISRLFW